MSSELCVEPVLRWYAVAVQGRKERAAQADLEKRGLEVFLPMRCERRAWSDRIQLVESALFPGYMFVHTVMTAARPSSRMSVPPVHLGRLDGPAFLDRPGRRPDGRLLIRAPRVRPHTVVSLVNVLSFAALSPSWFTQVSAAFRSVCAQVFATEEIRLLREFEGGSVAMYCAALAGSLAANFAITPLRAFCFTPPSGNC